jgi:hypothetical protein
MMKEKRCPKCAVNVLAKISFLGLEKCPNCGASLDHEPWVQSQNKASGPLDKDPANDESGRSDASGIAAGPIAVVFAREGFMIFKFLKNTIGNDPAAGEFRLAMVWGAVVVVGVFGMIGLGIGLLYDKLGK